MIEDLCQRIIEASGLEVDRKWSPWVKRIDEIDPAKKGGYMFTGEYIQDRTIEHEPKAGLTLACARHGSRKYNRNYYRLVLLHPSGDIMEPVGDEISDEDRGWALLLKPEVEKQLLTISSYYAHSGIPPAEELPMEPQVSRSDCQGGKMRTETVTITITYPVLEARDMVEPSSVKIESGAYEVVSFSPADVSANFYWQTGAVFLRLLAL